jgi:hypothetical protein
MSFSSLPVVARMIQSKALFVSRFSPQVTSDVGKSLKGQLKLTSLVYTRLKTKLTRACLVIFLCLRMIFLFYNTGVWPRGCLIAPFYDSLSADQIYSVVNTYLPRPSLPNAGIDILCDHPPAGSGSSIKYDRAHEGGAVSTY